LSIDKSDDRNNNGMLNLDIFEISYEHFQIFPQHATEQNTPRPFAFKKYRATLARRQAINLSSLIHKLDGSMSARV
jgi:hypothetical protein